MEPQSSLQCSKELSAGSYPEPDQSSLYHPNPISLTSILISFLPGSFFLSLPLLTYTNFLPPYSFYMPCPSHSPWFGDSNYTWRRGQVMKLLVTQFSPLPSLSISLQSKYISQRPFSNTSETKFDTHTAPQANYGLVCSKHSSSCISKQLPRSTLVSEDRAVPSATHTYIYRVHSCMYLIA
jgi:hypothetical protein